MEDLTF